MLLVCISVNDYVAVPPQMPGSVPALASSCLCVLGIALSQLGFHRVNTVQTGVKHDSKQCNSSTILEDKAGVTFPLVGRH